MPRKQPFDRSAVADRPPKKTAGPKQPKSSALTVQQINADRLTQLANEYWSPNTPVDQRQPFDGRIVDDIYEQEIRKSSFSSRRIVMLEFSQYLENYLWPNYRGAVATRAHMMSIVVMVNEKVRERVDAWAVFQSLPDEFGPFFQQVLEACLPDAEPRAATDNDDGALLSEQIALVVFLNHCFNSMEVELCREQAKRLVSLAMWSCLQPKRREQELNTFPEWRKFWKKLLKRDRPEHKERLEWERHFLLRFMVRFMRILESIPESGELQPEAVRYCERFLEFLVDLEALLPTRRFFNTVLDDCHLVVRCSLAPLTRRDEGKLFVQLLDMLKFYARFEINDESGDALTDHDMMQLHYTKIIALQRAAFAKFPDLRMFALSNVGQVDTRDHLTKHFGPLNGDKLKAIASYLNLIPDDPQSDATFDWHRIDEAFLRELLISRHERRVSQLDALNEMPLYPTEEIIWDENIVPNEYFGGDSCLALPKLNLQFLTLHDYLLRNFNLFRLESTYEIRQDIEDAVSRMLPWKSETGDVVFGGWARMALPIASFAVIDVAKPHIGERKPSRVRADINVTLSVRKEIQVEWENLRKHDVCFLVTVRPTQAIGTRYNNREPFGPQVGLTRVRGCEIEGMLDANGHVIDDGPDARPQLAGEQRTYRVWLDCNQYRLDSDRLHAGDGDDVYEEFNILVRRKPKENNFKAVLETIRHLMNTECVVPAWLHDILLGYGDPGSAHYRRMPNQKRALNFNDTFLDVEHLRESFPGYEVKCDIRDEAKMVRPFKLTFEDVRESNEEDDEEEDDESELPKVIRIEPYQYSNRGPYVYNEPKKNTIRFTPTQVEAIRAGMQPGLTLVVGPPGTGKTDVAVQIISNIYHNHPNQRTLIVTHSNQALNQLFEKIMALDIDERHLLRLGHGEESLETEKDFSRYGRVNYVLSKRLELLGLVQRLQESLGVKGDLAYTCETAGYFYLYQVIARWEKFQSDVEALSAEAYEAQTFAEAFPFGRFFADAPQPLFAGRSYAEDMQVAVGCYAYISRIFTQLEEFRAFELLRNGNDRSRYLLVKEAKIIAMTCTHAALKRKELVQMGFKYDNILMEESAQILEIETFIPLLLQNPLDGFNRLKRWIMIGDHHQLPPVIQNLAFQKYSNMEQSLFTRLVRLGVPTVDLDGQGRSRPGICALYKWRYGRLDDLRHVRERDEYRRANAGFVFDYQLIDVGDFNGVGESEPNAHFYQNLAEAEYVVAVFMYLRLLGYPAERISILTTYNGQKHLIRDVIDSRCGENALIGRPFKVTTVDKYQGQQNDFVLISLVRTQAVGHLRDVRRLVVAMSRARFGLYVFGRAQLFRNCFELQPVFRLLMDRPQQLQLLPDEQYTSDGVVRVVDEPVAAERIRTIVDMSDMADFVYKMYMERVDSLKEQMESLKTVYEQMPAEEQDNEDDENMDDKQKLEKRSHKKAKPFQQTAIQNEVDDVDVAMHERKDDVEAKADDGESVAVEAAE